MKAFLEAQGVQDVIEWKDLQAALDEKQDKMAMTAIHQEILEDLLLSVAEKESAKMRSKQSFWEQKCEER